MAINRALNLNPNDLLALSLSHEMLLATDDVEGASRRAQHLLKLAPLGFADAAATLDCRCQLGLAREPPVRKRFDFCGARCGCHRIRF